MSSVLTSLPKPLARTAPFEEEPGLYAPAGLWLYGNVRLLSCDLVHIGRALGPSVHLPSDLDRIEQEAEHAVLAGKVLVSGIHSPSHQRAAVVPLRWGSPRILVLSGGFKHHLGESLDQEPFRAARLWRYSWDAKADLVISRRAPEKLPTYGTHNPTVDRLIARIAAKQVAGVLFEFSSSALRS